MYLLWVCPVSRSSSHANLSSAGEPGKDRMASLRKQLSVAENKARQAPQQREGHHRLETEREITAVCWLLLERHMEEQREDAERQQDSVAWNCVMAASGARGAFLPP